MIVGGESWREEDCARLLHFAERWNLPVACAFRCQDRFPNDHANYAGDAGLGINPGLAERIGAADLIVALGARLGDCTTSSYTLPQSPKPAQGLVHVHADAEELGRVYQADVAINAGVSSFLRAAETLPAAPSIPWTGWTEAANADYRAWTDTATMLPGEFNLGEAVIWLRENLVTTDDLCGVRQEKLREIIAALIAGPLTIIKFLMYFGQSGGSGASYEILTLDAWISKIIMPNALNQIPPFSPVRVTR